tara:strand:+ start:22297 stop:22821 length:525 start_codon:yes stop_codon:yes gene_type:complete
MGLHGKFGSGNSDSNPTLKPNDLVMTPRHIAKQMIDFYDLSEVNTILDPCRGGGSFYEQYPCKKKDWCEISEGRDFFTWSKKVDWIITNPPYSIFPEFLEKCFEVADNVALLIPMAKLVSSLQRINMVMEFGGIVSMRIIGASRCGFPFGFPAAAIEMRRDFRGPTQIEMWPEN